MTRDDSAPKIDSKLGRRTVNFVEVILLLSLTCILTSFLGKYHFLFDLTTHFRVQAAVALVVGGLILLVVRRRVWGLFCLVVGLMLSGTLAPYFVPPPMEPTTHGRTYRLLCMNVFSANKRHADVVDYLQEQNPDVILLIEVTGNWQDVFDKNLLQSWPYRLERPRSDNFGIAVYSRHPLARKEIVGFTDLELPSIDVDVKLPEGAIRLIGIHSMTPTSVVGWKDRNLQLSHVAAAVQSNASHAIVAGDFNCTPWSSYFGRFLKDSGLRDSAIGYGLRSTWSLVPLPLTGLMIDHICVGGQLSVVNRFVGPPLGSDHRAVVIDFVVEPEAAPPR